ncbi:unnamed protein product [Strongylus vulgaris]|uniref:Uncharacterized protein n=1 Tax=Strongylus vulgaris TaxID=40348 RepID=A0A3P7IWZ3_STRVU|nr:unnamed protein product [Strongylus vulgaris]
MCHEKTMYVIWQPKENFPINPWKRLFSWDERDGREAAALGAGPDESVATLAVNALSKMWQVTLCYAVFIVPLVSPTTEWWGDLRAHLNPSRTPAFYDVTYDETGIAYILFSFFSLKIAKFHLYFDFNILRLYMLDPLIVSIIH